MNSPTDPLHNFAAPGEPGSMRDTRLIARAVREEWPIPDAFRKPVVMRQIAIATNPNSKNSEATAAARCLANMNAQNIKSRNEQHSQHIHISGNANVLINASAEERRRRLAAIGERIRARRLANPIPPGGSRTPFDPIDDAQDSEGASGETA